MNRFVKHVFLSDHQIPDQDDKTIALVNKFILDFKPDKVHIVGDFLNFTKVAKYDQDPFYHKTMQDEIKEGRTILKELVAVSRKANAKTEIVWYEGNHEARLIKYLGKNASALAEITGDDGEYYISIPSIFGLKKLGVKWIPYMKRHDEHNIEIEHGDRVRQKSGYTAHAMLDKRGKSGISGHTHRLAMIMKTTVDSTRWWIENGCLCKRIFESPYTRDPDWQQGFTVGIYDKQEKTFHPTIVPIFNHAFMYGGKIYE